MESVKAVIQQLASLRRESERIQDNLLLNEGRLLEVRRLLVGMDDGNARRALLCVDYAHADLSNAHYGFLAEFQNGADDLTSRLAT